MSMELSGKINQLAKFFLLVGVFFIPTSTFGMDFSLALATLLVLCSGQWDEKKAFIVDRPALWIPSLLFLLMLVATLHGIVPWYARLHVAKKYLQLLFIPFLAWLFIDESIRKKALIIFLSVMIFVWITSILYFYVGIPIHFHLKSGSSIFHDYISIGFLSVFSIFVLIHLQEKMHGYKKYFLITLAFMGAWHVFFISPGRTGDFIFLGLIIYFFWEKWRWKGFFASLIFVGVLFTILFTFSSVFYSRVAGSFDAHLHYNNLSDLAHTSTMQRITSIKASATLLKQHPFVGVGTGSFYDAAAKLSWMKPELNSTPVSNEWLNIAVQTGVLGFVVVAMIYFRQWRETSVLPVFYQKIGRLLVLTMLLGGIIGTPLVDGVEAHFYCIFAALCFSSSYQKLVKNK